MIDLSFNVYGTPRPAGSKKAFINSKTGRPIITDATGPAGKDWRASIQHEAIAAMQITAMRIIEKGIPLMLQVKFNFLRPKSHFGTGRNSEMLKDSAPECHIKAPDTTKLVRAVEDALNRVLWHDDSQIVAQFAEKYYSDWEGAAIKIKEWT